MSGEIIQLITSTIPAETVDAATVAACEQLLARAKAGKFNGLVYATITCPQAGLCTESGTGWAGEVRGAVHMALGTVDVLKERMLRELMQWS